MDYYKKIDGLRFLAIFCVLIQHFAWEVGKLTNAGWFGVDLFFVISGFLITSILIRINEGSIKLNYLKFIGRRTLRIFPIYYIAVLILWFLGVSTIRENLVYFLTYTFNYAWVKYNIPQSIVHHFWSLVLKNNFMYFGPLLCYH